MSELRKLRVYEIFQAIQGEGTLVGTPSLFIRLHGCNLKCDWCDTPETSINAKDHEYQSYEIPELVDRVLDNSHLRHLVITGGEPLIQNEALLDFLQTLGGRRHVTLETNGYKREVEEVDVDLLEHIDLLSISPKLHVDDWQSVIKLIRHHAQVWSPTCAVSPDVRFIQYRGKQQVKIVVCDKDDLTSAVKQFRHLHYFLHDSSHPAIADGFVRIIQPEGSRGPEWANEVAAWVTDLGFGVFPSIRVIPQVHKLIGVR